MGFIIFSFGNQMAYLFQKDLPEDVIKHKKDKQYDQ